jgi:hypothetical protein
MATEALAPSRVAPLATISRAVSQRADAAAGLHAHPLAHHAAHEGHVLRAGAALGEARGGLHEVGPCVLAEDAGDHLLLVGEQGGLQDHLHEGAPPAGVAGGRHHGADVLLDLGVRPLLRNPTLSTMSTSVAPSRTACAASAALIGARFAPKGKPITVHTAEAVPRSSAAASGTQHGLTHTLAKQLARASAQSSRIRSSVVSGVRTVWSIIRAIGGASAQASDGGAPARRGGAHADAARAGPHHPLERALRGRRRAPAARLARQPGGDQEVLLLRSVMGMCCACRTLAALRQPGPLGGS